MRRAHGVVLARIPDLGVWYAIWGDGPAAAPRAAPRTLLLSALALAWIAAAAIEQGLSVNAPGYQSAAVGAAGMGLVIAALLYRSRLLNPAADVTAIPPEIETGRTT